MRKSMNYLQCNCNFTFWAIDPMTWILGTVWVNIGKLVLVYCVLSDDYFRDRRQFTKGRAYIFSTYAKMPHRHFKEKNTHTTRRLTLASVLHSIHFILPSGDAKTLSTIPLIRPCTNHGRKTREWHCSSLIWFFDWSRNTLQAEMLNWYSSQFS